MAEKSPTTIEPALLPRTSSSSTDSDPELGLETRTRVKATIMEPSRRFTAHQILYIFILDGLGGMLLSGGVNFALAFAMYTTQTGPIRLWQFPNTLAGDAAVTIFVQCILTWFVEHGLVRYDLSRRGVQPVGFIAEPEGDLARWLLMLPNRAEKTRDGKRGVTVWAQVVRALMMACVAFVVIWPASVGVMTALGEEDSWDRVYADRWTPQLVKMVVGGVLGLSTTPLMALYWLVRAGWEAGW